MNQQEAQPSPVRQRVNDLVLAEMFLLQATIESATAIGDGIQALSRNLNGKGDELEPGSGIANLLEHTMDKAIEPYASRYQYYRKLMQQDEQA